MPSGRGVEENSEGSPYGEVWLELRDQGGQSRGCEVREDIEDQFIEVSMKVLVFMSSENRKPLDDFE